MSTKTPDAIRFKGAKYIKVEAAAPKPYFPHDCDACVYLGSAAKPDGARADFYVDEPEEAAIIRWGSRGQDYRSMPLRMIRSIPADDQTWGVWRFFYETFSK